MHYNKLLLLMLTLWIHYSIKSGYNSQRALIQSLKTTSRTPFPKVTSPLEHQQSDEGDIILPITGDQDTQQTECLKRKERYKFCSGEVCCCLLGICVTTSCIGLTALNLWLASIRR
jgi:hypothetical protein